MLKFPFQRIPFAAFTLHGVVLGHWLITPMKVAPPEKRVNICQHLKNGYFELLNTAPTAAARPPIPSTGTRLPRPPTATAAARKGWRGSLWKTFYSASPPQISFGTLGLTQDSAPTNDHRVRVYSFAVVGASKCIPIRVLEKTLWFKELTE